ncbi:MAG: recombination regulator RecX [Burkholderiaceae bacterium]
MPLPAPSLKGRALRLLGMREHSRAELERKLKRHEEEPGQLAEALDQLQSKGFISEQRVLDSVLHSRLAKFGAARIKQELQGKGLDPAMVKATVAQLQASEFERARLIWSRKFSAQGDFASPPRIMERAERARQMRFLAARGFGADTIRRVFNQVEESELPDD